MRTKVLLIENNLEIVKIITDIVTQSGGDLQTVNNGLDGIEKLKQEEFDILILKPLTPRLDGLSILSLIHEKGLTKNKPFTILLSSVLLSFPNRGEFFSSKGIDDFIPLPFNVSVLTSKLQSYISHFQLVKEGKERGKPEVKFAKFEEPQKRSVTVKVTRQEEPISEKLSNLKKNEGRKPEEEITYITLQIQPDGELRGNFQDSNSTLSNVLGTLCKGKQTGILLLKKEAIIKQIFLVKGKIIDIKSDSRSDSMEAFLKKRGIIPEDEYLGIPYKLSLVKEGEFIIQKGLIKENELKNYLKMATLDILSSTSKWVEGTYKFTPINIPETPPIEISLKEIIQVCKKN